MAEQENANTEVEIDIEIDSVQRKPRVSRVEDSIFGEFNFCVMAEFFYCSGHFFVDYFLMIGE